MPTKIRRAAREVSPKVHRPLPPFFTPMVAQAVDRIPEGTDWLYELKLDGYRALLFKDGETTRLRSRNDKDLTSMYPSVAAMGTHLRADNAIVDGEIVAVDTSGRPSFQALQHRTDHSNHVIVMVAFDLPFLDGVDLMSRTLNERRGLLEFVVADSGIIFSVSLPGSVQDVVAAVKKLELEGVMAKRRSSVYVPGDRVTGDWLKLKLELNQEFVVGGYRPGSNGVDALLVGYYEKKKLRFAGKVRAGFVSHLRRELLRKLIPMGTDRCPFADLPSGSSRWGGGVTAEEMAEMRWVRPRLVVQIQFVQWTADGRLRHAKFLGLRADKKATEVFR
jgi:bifunctional non-homologous end joining protein LigD